MKRLLLPASLAVLAACVSGPPAAAPAAEHISRIGAAREATFEELHGERVPDPYRWLEDGASSRTQAWTRAQDAAARAHLAALPNRDAFAARLKTLLAAGALGDPKRRGGRLFYSERKGEQRQAVLKVREGDRTRALVDPNALSRDGTTALDWWEPSPDGSLVAYGLSEGGSEDSVLRVRDAASGRDLPDVIDRARHCSVAWNPDGASFYYTRYPKPGRVPAGEERYHRHVFLHRLGSPPEDDEPVWGEGRPKEDWPSVSVSNNGRWLVIEAQQGWSRSELWGLDLSDHSEPFPIAAGRDALYSGTAAGDTLYVLTNEDAPRYRVLAVDLRRPERGNWRVIVPESEAVVEAAVPVQGGLLVAELVYAASRLRLVGRDGADRGRIPLPAEGSLSGLDALPGETGFTLRFQSFLVPPALYAGRAGDDRLERLEAVPAAADLSRFSLRRESFQSKDGTPVPVFILTGSASPPGPRSTILYGYGGFNVNLKPAYQPARLAWLERGGAFAVAILRGGGEFGEPWHRAGMLGAKQNVFDDFLAAAAGLAGRGLSSPGKLAILGGSNGGLLVCAALTQRPELFSAAIAQVPLADMLRYHRSLIARLWIPEYGSAEDPAAFRWLKAYSPYHRAGPAPYPAVLLTTGESDTRVDPMHARKMAAQLQWASTSGNPVLLRYETRAGHGAGKPLDKSVDEWADVLAFAAARTGLP